MPNNLLKLIKELNSRERAEVERWFKYRNNRNSTAHDYGEGFAEETLVLMPDFISDVKKLLERLENVNN